MRSFIGELRTGVPPDGQESGKLKTFRDEENMRRKGTSDENHLNCRGQVVPGGKGRQEDTEQSEHSSRQIAENPITRGSWAWKAGLAPSGPLEPREKRRYERDYTGKF